MTAHTEPVVSESRIRVRYAETDQMGVVYHSNHFIWFEVGRVDLLRQLGFTYKQMEKDDQLFIPLVDARCRYKAPALYDDELIVRTHVRNFREKIIVFAYDLVRASDNTLLAEGETTHVITGSDLKARSLPEKYMAALAAAAGKPAANGIK
jgi:acyl-CoA thioester hydrolase